MTTDDLAKRGGDDDLFYLTKGGASEALNKGERLDPEDFA